VLNFLTSYKCAITLEKMSANHEGENASDQIASTLSPRARLDNDDCSSNSSDSSIELGKEDMNEVILIGEDSLDEEDAGEPEEGSQLNISKHLLPSKYG
jgi:hypothetical protein